MLVSSLVGENLRALFAPESCVVEHVFYHVDDPDFFEFVSAVGAVAVAPAFPLVDAALASENLTLTAADHVLHDVPANGANELFNLLTVLIDDIIRSESLSRAGDLLLSDALDQSTNALDKLHSPLFGLLNFLCHWGNADPSQGVFISCWLCHWSNGIGCNLCLRSHYSGAIRQAACTIVAIAILQLE